MSISNKYKYVFLLLVLGLCSFWVIELYSPSRVFAESDSYIIGPEDQLSIVVWQHTDLSLDVLVGPDGMISYPLIGALKVSGMTRTQAQDTIINAYKKYLVDPKVNVSISGYNSFRIKVLGMVTNSGYYSMKGKSSLVTAIALAGGTNSNAQLRQVNILRGTDKILIVDLYKILYEGKMALDVPLEPNDTVFVPDNRNTRVFVLGYVQTPGIIDLQNRLTVLEAIMKSGGYSDGANLSDVMIIRGNQDKPQILHVNLQKQIKQGIPPKNQELQSGDIVYVSRGLVASLNYILDKGTPALKTIILGDSALQALQGTGGSSVVTPVQ